MGKDLVAGIVLCALLVPQGMAYAELAGLPAITGLYTTVVCLFAYAALGPSPYLVLGPDSSLGPMIAAVILPLAAGDDAYAIALAGMLLIVAGACGQPESTATPVPPTATLVPPPDTATPIPPTASPTAISISPASNCGSPCRKTLPSRSSPA